MANVATRNAAVTDVMGYGFFLQSISAFKMKQINLYSILLVASINVIKQKRSGTALSNTPIPFLSLKTLFTTFWKALLNTKFPFF